MVISVSSSPDYIPDSGKDVQGPAGTQPSGKMQGTDSQVHISRFDGTESVVNTGHTPGLHSIPSPEQNGAVSSENVSGIIDLKPGNSLNALSLVEALMCELLKVAADLHQTNNQLAMKSRDLMVDEMDTKARKQRRQGDAQMGFGIASAVIGGAGSLAGAGATFALKGPPQLVMMQAQGLTGLFTASQGIVDACGRHKNADYDAEITTQEKLIQLANHYMDQFTQGMASMKSTMESSTQAYAGARQSDNQTFTAVIGKMS